MPTTLKLADGSEIDVKTGEVIQKDNPVDPIDEEDNVDEGDEGVDKLQLVGTYKATDLPERGKLMAVISAVVSFELWGLSSLEISKILETDDESIADLQHSEAYIEFKKGVLRNVMRALDDDVRGMLAKHSLAAAKKLVGAMSGRNKKEMEVKAAESILDRSGFGTKSVTEHHHKMDDELVIRVIKDTGAKNLPTIDLKTN